MSTHRVIIVTGQSGSGRSTAIRALEDRGYFCVDNIPASLVEPLLAIIGGQGASEGIALGMDIREPSFLDHAPRLLDKLRGGAYATRLLFLEAAEEALLRRYSETRRAHPLDHGCGLRAAIHAERERLAPLRELADDTLDTTAMSPHDLRHAIKQRVAPAGEPTALTVGLLSFGFKNGLPSEADMVFDVRFLPNPYFVPELREKTGLDEDVRQFVIDKPEAKRFLEYATALLEFLLPQYQREGKRYLTVAIGCTGGQHRSVSMARELTQRLAEAGFAVDLHHRDAKETQA